LIRTSVTFFPGGYRVEKDQIVSGGFVYLLTRGVGFCLDELQRSAESKSEQQRQPER
jgi:hypothetical protein